jgi:Uma2 family endonuclease
MAKKPIATEKRVVLSGVNWQKFELLLDELGANRAVRMTYDRGKLEMMTPLEEHSRCSRLVESLILVFAEEVRLDVQSLGSVLLKQSEIGRAIQPESCYYVGQEIRFRDRAELEMQEVAPPDLVVDVAIADGKFDRLSIYDSLEVPEIWRYKTQTGEDALKGELKIYQRRGDRYVESLTSQLFPFLPGARIQEFLEQSDTLGLAQALQVLRNWIQEHL